MTKRSRSAAVAPLCFFLVVTLAWSAPELHAQQQVTLGSDVTLEIGGILSATAFWQDATFLLGNGQQANIVATELEDSWHGGDARNMRLNLGLEKANVIDDWNAKATFETDFFGVFPAPGAFTDEQPGPRLRLAYVDLTNGRTTLRVGQDWALTLGNIPVSTSHVGFPFGWGSGGFIGWRFTGVQLHQALSAPDAPLTTQLQLGVFKGSWATSDAGDGPDPGEAGIPQLEAKLKFNGMLSDGVWGAYVVGHYDRKDLNGVREVGEPEPPEDNLDGWALEAGGNVTSGRVTVQGNAYVGRAMGHQFASLIQFGDIGSWGAWGQVGLDLDEPKRWSLWLFYGLEQPDEEEVRDSGNERLESWLLVPMLRFKAGPYSMGLEFHHNETTYATGPTTEEDRKGNQILLSARFDF